MEPGDKKHVHLFIEDPKLFRTEDETYRCSRGFCCSRVTAQEMLAVGRRALWRTVSEEGVEKKEGER